MSLFRRNKTDQTGMPTEVQDYYTSQKRERTGLAWLLALGTLLVTVLLVLGLFFGGRWAFRQLKNNDDTSQVAVEDEKAKEGEDAKPAEPSNGSAPASQPAPATQTPPASTPSPAPATTPTTSAASNSNLPNTGPGDTLAIFAAVSVLAYFAHRRFLAE